jgi:hypothetical protein
MTSFLSLANAPVLFLLIALLVNTLGLSQLSPFDFVIVFALGILTALIYRNSAQAQANKIMSLILYRMLLGKGVVNPRDAFLSQNSIVGDTYEGDIKKVTQLLKKDNVYLHGYLTDEEIKENNEILETRDLSIFQSYTGLVDTYKESYLPKIVKPKE